MGVGPPPWGCGGSNLQSSWPQNIRFFLCLPLKNEVEGIQLKAVTDRCVSPKSSLPKLEKTSLTMWSTTEMGSIEGTIYMRSRYKTGIYSRMSVRNAIQELYILHFIGKIQGCTRLKKYFCRYFPKHWLASASSYLAIPNIIDMDSRGPGFFHYPSLQD